MCIIPQAIKIPTEEKMQNHCRATDRPTSVLIIPQAIKLPTEEKNAEPLQGNR